MPKYLKIAPDPDARVCHCGDGNPNCDHWESCDGCGMDYRKHEGHDCIDGVPVQDLRPLAKELRDSLDACEMDRDRLRAELDAAHDGEDALRSEVTRLRAQIAALHPEERRVGADEVVVSMDEWEALNAFLEDWRAPESRSLHDWNTSLKAKAARINALRTSAQDHNGSALAAGGEG